MTIVLKGWAQEKDRLVKDFKFKNFKSAIAFMVELSSFIDHNDHHPEWTNIYDTVHVELTTHDTGGISDKDMVLAAQMDKVFDRY
jgi:4a-hydroxytetrahydrobiopterin dehydratase